jgi:hypothetical protein
MRRAATRLRFENLVAQSDGRKLGCAEASVASVAG